MTPDAAVQRGPTIELYDSPVSTSGQKVRMTLLEKGLARPHHSLWQKRSSLPLVSSAQFERWRADAGP
jgi:hypothetical protein